MSLSIGNRKRSTSSQRGEATRKRRNREAETTICEIEVIKEDQVDDNEEYLSFNTLSEYEVSRLENIKKNEQMLQHLNIKEAKLELDQHCMQKSKSISRGLQRTQKEKTTLLPRRKSLRILGRSPDGDKLLDIVTPVAPSEEHPRQPSGPLPVTPSNDIDVNVHGQWLHQVKSLSSKVKVTHGTNGHKLDMESYARSIRGLRLHEGSVVKVVPERIFSIAVHPSETKTLIFVGDKWGHLGVLDVNSRIGQDGVYLYEPHSRPINCLKINPLDASKLYSCSYDGTIRCCDLKKELFLQTLYSEEDLNLRFNAFSFVCNSPDTMLVADSEGNCSVVDDRSGKIEKTYNIHKKSARGIDCHPTNPNLFASGSVDAEIALWDLRKISSAKSKIGHEPVGKAVSSVYFSPVTGNKLLSTAMDDYIRIHAVEQKKSAALPSIAKIRHNNQTGRWLTKFRAGWDPKTDDCFVSGSMARPRQIEVFSADAKSHLIGSLAGEFMSSVASITECHPSKHIIVGGNSSGRVFVWQ